MDAKLAENLVWKWMDIKSLALGPERCFGKLSEVKNVYILHWRFN